MTFWRCSICFSVWSVRRWVGAKPLGRVDIRGGGRTEGASTEPKGPRGALP